MASPSSTLKHRLKEAERRDLASRNVRLELEAQLASSSSVEEKLQQHIDALNKEMTAVTKRMADLTRNYANQGEELDRVRKAMTVAGEVNASMQDAVAMSDQYRTERDQFENAVSVADAKIQSLKASHAEAVRSLKSQVHTAIGNQEAAESALAQALMNKDAEAMSARVRELEEEVLGVQTRRADELKITRQIRDQLTESREQAKRDWQQHKTEIETLQARINILNSKLEAGNRTVDAQLQALRDEHEAVLRCVEKKHAKELSAIEKTLSATVGKCRTLADSEASLKEQVTALEARIAAMGDMAVIAKNYQALQEEHRALQNTCRNLRFDKQQLSDSLDAKTTAYATLEEQSQATQRSLEQRIEDRNSDLDAATEARDQYRSKSESLLQELESTRAELVALQASQQSRRQGQSHAADMLEKMRGQWRQQVEVFKQEHDNKLDHIQNRSQTSVKRVETALSSEVRRLQAEHAEEIKQLRREHTEAIATQVKRHQTELKNAQSIYARTQDKLASAQHENGELRTQLATLRRDLDHAQLHLSQSFEAEDALTVEKLLKEIS